MSSKEDCLALQKPPQLEKGNTVREGLFARNLKKRGEISKRYANDDDATPAYGFKLTHRFWNNATRNGDMSINESKCISSDSCSIATHPHATDYYHVAIFNLAEINARLKEHPFAAQYAPITQSPDGPNACHFELLPMDGSSQSLFALETLLNAPFPSGRMPDGEENKLIAREATIVYRRAVEIHRWVRRQDGTLA